MPSQPNGEPTGSKARAEAAEDDKFTSQDTFKNPAIAVLVNTATVEDAQGIERIVAPTDAGWAPAPLEASDEEKQAASDREKMLADAKEQRLAALKGEIKDEDRLVNNPGVGGSTGGEAEEPQGAQREKNESRAGQKEKKLP